MIWTASFRRIITAAVSSITRLSSTVYSTELAEKFAEKQSGGNTIQYDNPMAVQENGGWRYAYGNMFYARLVKQYFDRVIVFLRSV